MNVVRMIGIDRDIHDLLDDMLWYCLLEFMNIPLMLEPEPVDRDVETAFEYQQSAPECLSGATNHARKK
ncbi:UNVERIFIED_CONTAM: hypothetical protein Slati_4603800 [Sesamum latifolium]|uniref:Uncharacterized protein n=1 Tax=Sesamum latifolium TaxID=2727402 RepID=A0AAW2S3Z3_9LAMI